jgi:hypothetical protein
LNIARLPIHVGSPNDDRQERQETASTGRRRRRGKVEGSGSWTGTDMCRPQRILAMRHRGVKEFGVSAHRNRLLSHLTLAISRTSGAGDRVQSERDPGAGFGGAVKKKGLEDEALCNGNLLQRSRIRGG